jgi:hypothetical protein
VTHQPQVSRPSVVVTCATSATVKGTRDLVRDADLPRPTLADVEAFVAELRKQGAGDDLVLGMATGLQATVELTGCA